MGSQSAHIELKNCVANCWLTSSFESYNHFKFKYVIFIADFCTFYHISKHVLKLKIWQHKFYLQPSTYSVSIFKGIDFILSAPPKKMFSKLVKKSEQTKAHFVSNDREIYWYHQFTLINCSNLILSHINGIKKNKMSCCNFLSPLILL